MARTHDLTRSGRVATLSQNVVAPRSVTAIAERRLHRSDAVQIEIDHLLKCCRSGTVAQAFRQGVEPRGTLGLDRDISVSAWFQRFVRLRRDIRGCLMMTGGCCTDRRAR